ncbi:hypothetical protein ACPDI4_000095 [Campylobacter upsaliensis]
MFNALFALNLGIVKNKE